MMFKFRKYYIIFSGWNAFGDFSFHLLRRRWHWLPKSYNEVMPISAPDTLKHRWRWLNMTVIWETPL